MILNTRTRNFFYNNLPLSASPKEVAVIAVHGRNQDETFMQEVLFHAGIHRLPTIYATAHNKTWYPDKFMAPIENNEADLNRSLDQLHEIHAYLKGLGYGNEQISFIGFSQGACLCSQYLLGNPSRYNSAYLLTGGFVGQPGINWNFKGDFKQTPIYITTSHIDEWVPVHRTEETAAEFERLGAKVHLQLFKNRPHEVCEEEISELRKILSQS